VAVVYLDEVYGRRIRKGWMGRAKYPREVILEGAVQRVWPKMMTVAVIMGGWLPINKATDKADVLTRHDPIVNGTLPPVAFWDSTESASVLEFPSL